MVESPRDQGTHSSVGAARAYREDQGVWRHQYFHAAVAADAGGIDVRRQTLTSIGPCRSVSGTTISRTLPRIFSSDQSPWLMKCNIDRCWAETRSGAAIAAIGDTLLRSPGSN